MNSLSKGLTIVLFIISVLSVKVNAQHFVVKTNMPYWLTVTPNLSAEMAVSRKISFELSGAYNPFKFANDKQLKHWIVWPEIRYWANEPFNGHFFGIHGFGGEYNLSGWDINISKLKPLKDRRIQGSAVGAGLSYGYFWVMNDRWGLELTAGLGVGTFNYEMFSLGENGAKLSDHKENYFGPTKGAFNLVYTIK